MTEKAKAGILCDIDWEAFKSGGKINVDSNQLMLLLGTMEAVRGSWRTMENPKSYRNIEEEKEEEKQSDLMRMENDLKQLNRAHHELVSALPELENNLKHIKTLVLILKQIRVMVDPGTFASLSVIISDIINEQRERFDNITGSINQVMKEEDAGI